MQINRFGAVVLAAAVIAAWPIQANQGGGGGGGGKADERLRKQEEPTPPTEPTPPAESILDSIDDGWSCPKPAGQTVASPAWLQDFYADTLGFLDANIARYRRLLEEKAEEIKGLDHKLAADFTAAHADDKTHDDTIESAKAALKTVPNPTVHGAIGSAPLGATKLADPDLRRAVNAINQARDAAAMLKRLEEARAIVAGEAKGCGVAVD